MTHSANPFRNPQGQPLIYGHRGARGLMPENTMAGFAWLRASGVPGVEMDVQISADGVPIIIHDPLVPAQIARDTHGNWSHEPGARIHGLTAQEIRSFDLGRLNPAHPYGARYPDQQPVDGQRAPLLADFLVWAAHDPTFFVNIEVKSFPDTPDLCPAPEIAIVAILDVIARHGGKNPLVISSFDWRVLAALHAKAPQIARGYLSYAQPGPDCTIYPGSPWMDGLSSDSFGGSLPRLIAAQGGVCWCPHFTDLTSDALSEAHASGLAVNVWTVNHPADLARMAAMGVDGIITDYPDRAMTRQHPETPRHSRSQQ
jgi:glycerophosphoryl diester phosphodiesterase